MGGERLKCPDCKSEIYFNSYSKVYACPKCKRDYFREDVEFDKGTTRIVTGVDDQGNETTTTIRT